ncbi:hypothetical protein [Gaetbulibacter jejuensis]|uniref:YD repeat-containing protein n=1 Tax=Gaetbulibacter jejuensis TaxID=584607 RepID=A0ABP3UTA0_9FLAO
MKNNLISLLLVTVIFSCSNSESNENDNQPKLIMVTELITQNGELTDFGPEGNVTYQYNSNNFVSVLTASGGYIKEFAYNSNNQVISETYNNENGFSYTINYMYENGLITMETYEDDSYIEFVYTNNLVSQMLFNYPNNPQNNSSISLTYDANGNIKTLIDDATSEIFESYDYDNMINPFSLLFPSSYNKIKRISNNNMTYREDCNRITVYDYNNQNLPLSSTYNDCGGFTKERVYFYE